MSTQVFVTSGSDEWHKFRSTHFGASEASAMLGLSPYKGRNDLLKEKKTGIAPEVSASTQKVFDRGHAVEEAARPIVEKQIGDELYQAVFEDGNLSASCDGLTLDGKTAWECKQYSDSLFKSVSNNQLPEHHWPQCQQVLMLTGAEKLIFTCSDGTLENTVSMTILPVISAFELLRSGWANFANDLAGYVPQEHAEAPKAEAIMQLPSVDVRVSGGLTASNLPDVTKKFDVFLANANTSLKTDQDFADGEQTAKFSRETAKKLKLTRQNIIDQTVDISEAIRTIDLYTEKFDALGLKLEKLVKSEKERIKLDIQQKAQAVWSEFFVNLGAGLGNVRLKADLPNFTEAMKNKRTISSLHDAVDTELANAKLKATSVANDVMAKLMLFNRESEGYAFLFNDLESIIYSNNIESLKLVIDSRVTKHKADEAAKLEAERVKIQQEEERKALALIEQERAKIKAEEDQKAIAAAKAEQERIELEQQAKAENIDREFIQKVAQIVIDKPMPTVQEMIDHLARHYGFQRHQIRDALKQEFNQAQAA